MKRMRFTRARRVETEADREKVLAGLEGHLSERESVGPRCGSHVPACDLQRNDVSWFLAIKNDRPVGVLRVLYDPPTEQY